MAFESKTLSFWFFSQISFPHGPEYAIPVEAISNFYDVREYI